MDFEKILGESDIAKVYMFIIRIDKLKQVYRYSQVKNKKGDSVADHSRRLSMMGFLVAKAMNLDLNMERILMLGLCHDLGEMIDGDIDVSLVYNGKFTAEDKDQREKKAMEFIVEGLPKQLKFEIYGYWEDYRLGISPEAKFMKALDKIEAITHYIQEDYDNPSFLPWMGNHGNKEVKNFPDLKEFMTLNKKLTKEFLSKHGIERKDEYNDY